ncbi:LysE family translocator [Puniceibacterium sediminis]|uniref:Threonine/homoserine/homoserine lactone efflux protein n=1 Tax=Puniceibacterium sediminis TaxID=1608407 RepID=A0A238Y2X5_9RHOB|nr:LysE family translocator [Puniceibacterium sediminis]SNR65322.1 Threonine/homoserine/homoserine lactone efflux protein [Puniceibacterium sediminis]
MIDTLLAMDPLNLLAFAGAGMLLNLTPGADVMFTMACGAQGGARAGIAAAAGIGMGSVFHILLTVLGVAAALQAVPHALDIIRWGGAAYLAWLAYSAWTAPADTDRVQGAQTLRRAFARGLLTNVLNPKVGLFILAFLPQFADPGLGPVWPQLLILGAIFVTTGFVITSTYGVLAGAFGAALRSKARLMNRISAVVFGGLAARLVLD